VPAPHRRLLFDGIHNLAHPGVRAKKQLIKSRFVWPGMGMDIADWCSECQACNRGKVTRHVKAPLQAIAVPDRRFSHLHVDLVGPLPPSQEGYSHLLTVIDRSSRWIEAIPMVSTSAQACADAVIGGWVAHFGIPDLITSDRGPQFTSAVWTALCKKLGIQHILTTAYHPQSNRMVERFHQPTEGGAALPRVRHRLGGPPAMGAYGPAGCTQRRFWNIFGGAGVWTGAPPAASTNTLHCSGRRGSSDAANGAASAPYPPHRGPQPDGQDSGPAGGSNSRVRAQRIQAVATLAAVQRPLCGSAAANSFDIFIGGRLETISVDRLKLHRGRAVPVPAAPPVRGRPKRV
jgi:hypothetical protein